MIDRTFNENLIKTIVTRPDMWSVIAEDGIDEIHMAAWEPNLKRDCWLCVHDGEAAIGLFQLKARNITSLEVHPYILKQYRGKVAKEAGIAMINWILVNYGMYKKLVGSIPVIHKNVILYCKQLGFVEEGVNRKSFLKNGELHDQIMIGMTLDEMKEVV